LKGFKFLVAYDSESDRETSKSDFIEERWLIWHLCSEPGERNDLEAQNPRGKERGHSKLGYDYFESLS
jgi:hypothetical protein